MQAPPHGWIRRFGVNALSSLATRLLSVTVLVWVNQHLLRRIAPEEYSLFPLVMSLVVFTDFFVAIFVGGVSRHLVEAYHRDDPEGVPRIVSSMMVVLIPASLALGVAGVLAAWNVDALLEVEPAYLGQARIMLLLTVVSVCLMAATTPFALGLYVRERFVTENLVGLACEILRIALLLTLMLTAGTRVMWLVVASTAATLANRSVQIALSRRLLPTARFDRGLVSRATMKEVISFGAWTSVYWVRQVISGSAPVLLLNRFATPLDVAMFHAGRLPENQIRSLLQAIEGPTQPALIELYSRRGKAAVDQLYYRGGRYYLWLVLLPVAALLPLAQPLYRLYAGDQYARAGLVMVLFLASFPFQFASGMYYRVAHAIGRIGAFHVYSLLLQLVTAASIAFAVAIRGGGAVAAALAIALTSSVLHVLMMWPMGLQLVQGKWRDFAQQTLARGLLPCGAGLVTCFALSRWIAVESWWTLGALACVSTIVYLAVLCLGCVDQTDRSLLLGALRSMGIRSFERKPDEQA